MEVPRSSCNCLQRFERTPDLIRGLNGLNGAQIEPFDGLRAGSLERLERKQPSRPRKSSLALARNLAHPVDSVVGVKLYEDDRRDTRKDAKTCQNLAAAKGLSLEQLVAEAIEDKIGRGEDLAKGEPRWMKLYGAFAKSEDMRTDTRSIQRVIDEEFERINPGDWK